MGIPNACCCNAVTCSIGSSERIADFTEVSGTWSEASDGFGNYKIQTSSADAIIIFSTAHPEGLSTGVVSVNDNTFPTSGKVRLLLAYQDADNYIFSEKELGLGIARLGQTRFWKRTTEYKTVPKHGNFATTVRELVLMADTHRQTAH